MNFSGSAHQTAGPQLAGQAAGRLAGPQLGHAGPQLGHAGPQLGHAGPQLGHAGQRQAQLGHTGPVHSQLTALQAQRDLHPICVLGMSRGNFTLIKGQRKKIFFYFDDSIKILRA